MYEIDVKNGELLQHHSATYASGFSGELSMVSSDILVALDTTRTNLVTIIVKNGEIKFQTNDISSLVMEFSGDFKISSSKTTGAFSVVFGRLTALMRVTSEGKIELVEKIDNVVAVSDALEFSDGNHAFALVQHEGSTIQLTVKDDGNTEFLKETIKTDGQRGLVHKVFINNYIRTDRSFGFRALMVMEDHSLLLVQQGETVWSREDGLASIIDVTTSELPVEKEGVSVSKVEHNLFEWLKVIMFCFY